MRIDKRILAGALATAFVAIGCASSGDMNTARDEAAQARQSAEDANRKAEMAVADAAAARAAAEAAAKDAREANEKADRIFQRSLHK
jgi:ABC-type molybdate transport system substrate-binding protein